MINRLFVWNSRLADALSIFLETLCATIRAIMYNAVQQRVVLNKQR